jgi:hypothetical protein
MPGFAGLPKEKLKRNGGKITDKSPMADVLPPRSRASH